jgi:hypothetical protein
VTTQPDFRSLCAELADRLQRAITSSKADYFYHEDRDAIDAARAALNAPPLTPIPASKRLPTLEDCDADGRCWFHSIGRTWRDWYLLKASSATTTETHWLPYWAIPLPEKS